MNRKTQKEMLPIVEGYNDYPGTKKEFCQEQGINLHVFNYWQKKLKDLPNQEQIGGFIPLQVMDIKTGEQMELVYPNGNRLYLPLSSPMKFIELLIKLSL